MDEPEMRRRRRLNRPVQLGARRYGEVVVSDGQGDANETDRPAQAPSDE